MLTKRIIPLLLVRDSQLVKGKGFDSWRSTGHAEQAARIYARRGVDELVILDIGATQSGKGPDLEMVKKMTEDNFCPVTVGGGVHSIDDVRNLLAAGADKVCLGTAALEKPAFVVKCAKLFGSQAIAVTLDTKDEQVWSHNGTKNHQIAPKYAAQMMQNCGAGEIIITSIERDGTMDGYNLELIQEVSSAVGIPVIAAGGCSGYEDMYHAIKAGADAVAAGALFQFTDATPKEAADYLNQRGIVCR